MFNPNQAFLLMQKLKSAPKGFTLGVKAELKKNPICNWEANLQPLGANVSAFINILTINVLAFISNLGLNNKPKMLKLGPQVFFSPES
jgi:hypothetical protein